MSFGGGGSPTQTAQQIALQTEQGLQEANLNLEENEQRKTILNALQGTRVFRGSALSRNVAMDQEAATGAPTMPGAPSASQQSPAKVGVGSSLVDLAGTTPGLRGPSAANQAGAIVNNSGQGAPGVRGV